MRKAGTPTSRPVSATAAAAAAANGGGLAAVDGNGGGGNSGGEKTSHSLWLYTRKFVRLLLIKPVRDRACSPRPTSSQLYIALECLLLQVPC